MRFIHTTLLCLALLLVARDSNAGTAGEPAASSSILPSSFDYEIAPRDLLQVQVFNQPDMAATQRVSASGEFRLALIGTVRLKGLTLRQAEQFIEDKYRERGYFVDPQVTLFVQEYGARFVTVLGQVKNPERLILPVETDSIGILEAISQAGGFTRVARTESIQIIRTSSSGADERIVVDVSESLQPSKSGTVSPEFKLRSGDIVFIPERVF